MYVNKAEYVNASAELGKVRENPFFFLLLFNSFRVRQMFKLQGYLFLYNQT